MDGRGQRKIRRNTDEQKNHLDRAGRGGAHRVRGTFRVFGDKTSGGGAPAYRPYAEFSFGAQHPARPKAVWADGKGRQVGLDKFEGKVVLFNYYASWCAPCKRELPGIDRLQASMAGKDFTVVAVNIDHTGKIAAGRLKCQPRLNHLDTFVDPQGNSGKVLGLHAMPTTFIFDRQGREVGKLEGGAEWDSKEARALTKYFIDRPEYTDNLPKK